MTRNTILILRDIVHAHGVIPSVTVLSDLMLDFTAGSFGRLTEAAEIEAMRVSDFVDDLGSEILVLKGVRQLYRSPTVLVSLRAFPEADVGFVLEHLAPLDVLGSRRDRRDALEIPLTAELQRQLPIEFRVSLRPNEFHGKCNDIQVIGPGRRMFNIETRNRRSEVHDLLKSNDEAALRRDKDLGITFIFVVPRCTLRFHRLVSDLGGAVIETNTYLVKTEEQRDILLGFGWMRRTVELSREAAPRIAAQVLSVVLDGYVVTETDTDTSPGTAAPVPMGEERVKSEIKRFTSLARSDRRLDKAEALYSSGVSNMGEAARLIGCSRRTLLRDLRDTGRKSPWSRGGLRRKADPEPK